MGIQRLLLCVAVVAVAAIGAFFSSPAAAEEPVKVLLVTGVDYPGHKWQETAPAVEALLEKDPRIVVDRVDDPEVLGTDRIFEYDVLLLHFKNYDPLKNIEQAKTNLRKFVEQGGA